MLTQMGVEVSVEGDEMVIEGHSLAQRLLSGAAADNLATGAAAAGQAGEAPGLLRGGRYTSHHDHRMVMALKVASLGADSPIEIDDEDCVAKSFPQFNALFASLCVASNQLTTN